MEECLLKRPRGGAEDQQASVMSEVRRSSGESQLVTSTAEAGPSDSQSACNRRTAQTCAKAGTKTKNTPWSTEHLSLLIKNVSIVKATQC